MQSIFDFVIKPKSKRYNNTKQIGDSELLLNSEISDHRYVSRNAIVLSVPRDNKTNIKAGDEVIVHHNVFRRWHDVRGIERNSRSYYKEDKYFVRPDQIFLYKQNNKWIAPKGFCFVKPIVSNNIIEKEVPLRGIIKHVDKQLVDIEKDDLVGFTPSSEYEFVIGGERLYRVPTNSISIKYERQGNEKEYNPSWT
jgi:hypothetical protein